MNDIGHLPPSSYIQTYVGARAYNNGVQSIPNGIVTAVSFNTNQFDSTNIHSTNSNTSRFTCPIGYAGKWEVSFCVQFLANSGSLFLALLRINNDGTDATTVAGSATYGNSVDHSSTNMITVTLSEGDYVEVFAYQSSGSSANIGASAAGNNQGSCCAMEVKFVGK